MKSRVTRYFDHIFWILAGALIIGFTLSQLLNRDPYTYRYPKVTCLTEQVSYLKEDGTLEPLTSKDMYFEYPNAKANQDNTIIMTLPAFTSEDMCLAVFTAEQDIKVFIDGEERASYCDKEYRKFGTYSTGTYIHIPLETGDSQKELRIVYRTTIASRASRLGVPLLGTEKNILCWILYQHGWQILSAVLLLAVGILFILFGILFKVARKHDKGLCYLGMFSMIMSLWLLCESDVRAYYWTYLSASNLMNFFALMMAPIPMLFFFNDLLKQEYHVLYNIAIGFAMINMLVSAVLECCNVIDVIEFLMPTHIIILATCAICLITFLKYIRKKSEIKEPWAVAIGMSGFIVTTVVEDINMLFFDAYYMGKYVGFGILFFLWTLAYSALKGIAAQEQEYQEAIKANSVKTAFLANMSHEIRTPINTILGMDEMILRENQDKEIEHYAMNIRDSGKILLSIVNDVLDFSRLEAGKREIIPRRYDFVVLLNDLINAVNIRAEEKNLGLELDIEESIPSILYGDDIRIKQAITNILTNAVKYTNRGTVTLQIKSLKISLNEIRLFISVTDTGIGIKQEDMTRMFDSFVRLETDRNRRIEGTGLGMAITKQIIDMMQGELKVESEYGKGSTFSVSFTQRVLDDVPIGSFDKWYRVGNGRARKYVEQYQASDVRLLVVDDNEMNLEVIKGLLKKTDMQIDCVESGYECLKMVEEREYDLIFLDHMMPGMDGVETLKKLQERRPKGKLMIPVVALTANAISGAREEYLKYGFADYISKPVEYRKLIEVLVKFLPDKLEKRADIKGIQAAYEEYLERNGIHMEAAMKYAGDDLEQYIHLLELFTSKKAQEKKISMHEAFRMQEWQDYTVYVHGLKNSARTIGADKLADMAYEHEIRSKAGDFTYLHEHYPELIHEWDKVVKIIKDYLDGHIEKKEKVQTDLQDMSETQWEESVERVLRYLDTFKKKEALLLLEQLAGYRLEEGRRQMIEQAIQAVQSYDYEEAIQTLKQEI